MIYFYKILIADLRKLDYNTKFEIKKHEKRKPMQYSVLSQIYDQLMVNVDYEMWASYIEYLILEQGKKPLNILELGCGSGNVTEKLLEKGYEVVGIDYSEEMLEIAEEKTEEFGNCSDIPTVKYDDKSITVSLPSGGGRRSKTESWTYLNGNVQKQKR